MTICRLLLLPFLLLSLCSCSGLGFGSSGEKLGTVDYLFIFAMQTTARRIAISPTGHLQIRDNRTADQATTKFAESQLTPDQMRDLARLFQGWNSLKDPKNVVVTGPVIDIAYNGYKVEASGATGTPPKFLEVMAALDQLGNAALVAAAQSATQPSTVPATTK